ncbi:hypothetical protein N9B82_01310 [Saprospiraceae bacterium]|nr:hypothetical protein [Saprospiraceae bacterium]
MKEILELYNKLTLQFELERNFWREKSIDEIYKLRRLESSFFEEFVIHNNSTNIIDTVFRQDLLQNRLSSIRLFILAVDKNIIPLDNYVKYFEHILDYFIYEINSNLSYIFSHLYILEALLKTIQDYPFDVFIPKIKELINKLYQLKYVYIIRICISACLEFLDINHSVVAKKTLENLSPTNIEVINEIDSILAEWDSY